jgi:secreted trypsin-like serine protease
VYFFHIVQFSVQLGKKLSPGIQGCRKNSSEITTSRGGNMKCQGKVLLAVAAIIALAGCGAQKGNGSFQNSDQILNGIVNGRNVTKADQYSQHVVFLQVVIQENGKQGVGDCTGSILDNETILTAGHCIAGAVGGVIVFANNTQNSKTVDPSMVRKIDKVAVYPKFKPEPEESARPNKKGGGGEDQPVQIPGPDDVPSVQEVQQGLDHGGFDYDLAVIHFTGGLPAGYTPVTLASDASVVAQGSTLQMIGYGLSQVVPVQKVVNGQTVTIPQPVQSTVGQLRETTSPVAVYDTKIGMILTDSRQTGVCNGDSGGPGFMRDSSGQIVQVGIAEAVANPYCNSVSMHTAVFPYLNWIKQAAAKLKSAAPEIANR